MKNYIAERPWLPYVLPMAVWMVFVQARVSWPQLVEVWYPLAVVVVAGLLWWLRDHYKELLFLPRVAGSPRGLAIGVGLLVIVLWIALDPFYPKQGELFHWAGNLWRQLTGNAPVAPDPQPLFDPTGHWAFIAFRVVGAVMVVPVMEELFWRGFLMRWLVNEDFRRVPVGTFSWLSFGGTVFLFGAAHSEWLAALLCGALYNWLCYQTRSIRACIVAHAVSNAALAGWVLATGNWHFW